MPIVTMEQPRHWIWRLRRRSDDPREKVGADLMTQAGYPGHLSKSATFDFPVAMQYTFSPSV